MCLMVPPVLTVRVYSPWIRAESRTRNVPSGASRSLLATSSLHGKCTVTIIAFANPQHIHCTCMGQKGCGHFVCVCMCVCICLLNTRCHRVLSGDFKVFVLQLSLKTHHSKVLPSFADHHGFPNFLTSSPVDRDCDGFLSTK